MHGASNSDRHCGSVPEKLSPFPFPSRVTQPEGREGGPRCPFTITLSRESDSVCSCYSVGVSLRFGDIERRVSLQETGLGESNTEGLYRPHLALLVRFRQRC